MTMESCVSTTDSAQQQRAVESDARSFVAHDVQSTERKEDPNEGVGQLPVEADSAPRSTNDSEDAFTVGGRLLTRFQQFGDLADLQRAISLLEAGIQFASGSDHHQRSGGLRHHLGLAFLHRFLRLGELSDLDQAISRHSEALELIPDGHPGKPACLQNLSNSFQCRYERLGGLGDLEQAISRRSEVVDLIPDQHPDKPGCLNSLAASLSTRFRRLGRLSDLEKSNSIHREVVQLIPDGHPARPAYLNSLGSSLGTRFKHLGDLGDIEESVSRLQEAVQLTPEGHPDRSRFLSNLGISLTYRFQRLGQLTDLEQAIKGNSKAVELTPDGHPEKTVRINNLVIALKARFVRLGELSDLESMISRQSAVAELIPDSHPEKTTFISNLASSLAARYGHLGELSDLEQALLRQSAAVELTPDGHPDRPAFVSSLANYFMARFARLGELSDIEQGLSRHQEAVKFTPDGHPEKPNRLSFLSVCFLTRFYRLGELSNLEQSILRQKEALHLTPDGHPQKPERLSRLAWSLCYRFERLGEFNDLEQSISAVKEALQLTPDGHPDKPHLLLTFSDSFLRRFRHLDELNDLEQSISAVREAVQLVPNFTRLGLLAVTLLARFTRLGEQSDLEQSISRHREAIQLIPDGHASKPGALSDLATTLTQRFQCLGEVKDLEQSISGHKEALQLIPDGHRYKPICLSNLANALVTRFRSFGDPSDLEQAINQYSYTATCASSAPTSSRFHASQQWIMLARGVAHHSLLYAYSTSIGLLPQLAWIGLSLTHRYHELMQGANVVREGAATALDLGHPELAVEWLEQGRSVVWGQLFQLRSSFDELSSAHPYHACQLQKLSVALEHAGTARDRSLSSLLEQNLDAQHHPTLSLEQEANRHRALAIERDELLQVIRGLPGFERFLLHKEFSQLRASAHSGPVVILNAAERRCDALIVLADLENVIHVPLPNFTLRQSGGLQNALESLLRHTGVIPTIPCDDRDGQSASQRQFNWESILSDLWKGVVKPVLNVLGFSTPGDLSRIFWCPTGPFTFLPIHAAGLYGSRYSEPGHKVSDFVISSYVPTLSILIPPPTRDRTSSGDCRVLAVPQPPSDGQSVLPGVHTELEHIRAIVRNSGSAQTTLLESSVGTVEEVLGLMKEADWVHFACHGVQDSANPTNSGLCLADQRRLKLSDIMSLSRPRGGLAFLSACQTATGDKTLSDEAVHIAAGMLFAGYEGVVATMWSISDRVAPLVAKDVYEQLFRGGEAPDYREAARALHNAVGRLRESGASFVEWVPFIHVGL